MKELPVVRRALLGVLAFGTAGTLVELFLIEHYEDTLQFIPLALLAFALAVLVWHAASSGALSTRVLRGTMVAFLVAGVAGSWLHYRGGAEFQIEIDPAQSRWTVFKKVIRAKAPPVLASGVMVQLGLLGLVYTYRHPSLEQSEFSSQADGVMA